MVVYDLECIFGHQFEGWFSSSTAFDEQNSQGQIQCTQCGVYEVRKLPSGCHVATTSPRKRSLNEKSPSQNQSTVDATSAPISFDAHTVLKAMHRWVNENCENVGNKFASEAIAMHRGEKPQRAICGTLKEKDHEILQENGVIYQPLPALPESLKN